MDFNPTGYGEITESGQPGRIGVVEQNSLQVMKYLDMVLRRKWLILIPFVVISFATVFYAVSLPPIYRSETTILVEPPQVPENYVQSTVTGSVQDRLNTISQQILSRTRLEGVIKELHLYSERLSKSSMEAVVNVMRKNTEIKVVRESRQRGATATFKLAFCGSDPATVQRVAQKLAMLYIEENLRVRENMARGTKDFMEKQLQEIEQDLRQLEEVLREFKQRYMGELPQQLEANLRSLDQLQQQKSSVLDSLRDAEDRQVLLEQQLQETPQYLTGSGTDQEDLHRQLELKGQQLIELEARYTDLYPDVVRLKREIRDLEKRIASSRQSRRGEVQPESSSVVNPAYTRIKGQVDANELNVSNLRDEIGAIDWKMKSLQRRVENTPKREQELMILTRDYETIKRSYDSMMERKINAEIAENLEIRQKSEQFRILDPANYPQKPVRPNRLKILAMGLALGLGFGGGLAFVVEFMDRSFRTVEEVKEYFEIPVLGAIPVLATTEEIRRQKIRKIAFASFSMGFILTSILGAHLFIKRLDVLMLDLVKTFM